MMCHQRKMITYLYSPLALHTITDVYSPVLTITASHLNDVLHASH